MLECMSKDDQMIKYEAREILNKYLSGTELTVYHYHISIRQKAKFFWDWVVAQGS